ncbi:MAG: multicopper oxidase family protein [Actinomycetota bacterium]|nr:multicopper oxidase family protein [Actinomycetota bacterium]
MRRVVALLVVAALSFTGCSGDHDDKDTSSPTVPAGEWNPTRGMPFAEPDQVGQGRDVAVTLDVKHRTIDVSGAPLGALPFTATPRDGQPLAPKLNGPTLHVSPGGTINVTFVNNSGQDTNIHYHGMHVSPLGDSDNVFRTFAPNTTSRSTVQVPANHPAGTYWYHVHFHGDSELQVNGGLSGLLIVDGVENVLPPALQKVTQRQFALREAMTLGGAVVNKDNANDKNVKTTRLVNALLEPQLSMNQSEYQLWRLANIGSDLFYHLRLQDHRFLLVAEDGNPVFNGRVRSFEELELPPGKRYDVLVLGGRPGSYKLTTRDLSGPMGDNNPEYTLATINVAASPAAPSMRPEEITVRAGDDGLRRSRAGQRVSAERTFVFAFDGNSSDINGQTFSPDRTDVAVELGAVEDWTLLNVTTNPHPFHIHVNEFQVLSINDVPYDAPGVQDVVTIPPMVDFVPGKVVIRNHYRDFTGWFVFHCHILAHEDAGMMATIQVLGPGERKAPPPSSGGAPMPTGRPHSRIKVG